MATGNAVGLYLYFLSKASTSVFFIVRDIGPSCAVPSIKAGGAVLDPLPSIWIFTLGYCLRNPSAQSVMRLLSVSEPMLLTFPDTPLTLTYAFKAGSSVIASSAYADGILAT